MRLSLKIAVSTIAIFGLSTSAPRHGPKVPPAIATPRLPKPRKPPSHKTASTNGRQRPIIGMRLASSQQTAAKTHSGGPIFTPEPKAVQAKEIHDQQVKDQKNGGPIFTPESKAEQAKEIHDRQVQQRKNGGPVFSQEPKAVQAAEIHNREEQQRKNGGPVSRKNPRPCKPRKSTNEKSSGGETADQTSARRKAE